MIILYFLFFFFSSRRRHTRLQGDWSSDVCSSDLVGGHEVRPDRGEAVEALADHPLARALLQIARGEVVAHAVAEHVRQRVGLTHVARDAAHHDDQLDLVVHLLRRLLGDPDDAFVAGERVVALVEENRRLGHGVARLRCVLAIVQAHADDLLGIRDAGAELDDVLGEHEARATGRALDEPGERLELAAALQHRVDGRRRPQLEGRLRRAHVDDALVGLDAEARLTVVPDRDERQCARQFFARGRGGRVARTESRAQARGGGGGAEDGRLEEGATSLVHERLLGRWTIPHAWSARHARPRAPAAARSQTEFTGVVTSSTMETSASAAVSASTIAARPSSHVTAAMRPSAATLTPSRNAAARREPRNRGSNGRLAATNTNEGTKMASVASRAPGHPASRKPMKVAVVNTGPGVTCPTATASSSCRSVSQPSRSTKSARRNASNTYPLP